MREDIQIYRGIAVLSVIFYHFNELKFPNGYLGVDLFFVISGFLITKQIIISIENKKFSFKSFYYKRFKRIFPSLVSCLIFTLFIGYYNLSFEHFFELIRGSLFSSYFIGNIYFSQVIDYFSVDSKKNLIINLWSLGIEEQFYLVFPLIIFFILKKSKIKLLKFLVIFIFLSYLSYNIDIYNFFKLNKIFFTYENYVFYSPFTRSWQLLIGSIAFVFTRNKIISKKYINYILILFLVALLLTRISTFNQILISLLSVYLLIFETTFNKNLILTLFKHFGDISFSLYLFHQPILAGIRNHNFYTTPQGVRFFQIEKIHVVIVIFIFIYLISFCNYLFIEQKFRSINSLKNINWLYFLSFFVLLNIFLIYPNKLIHLEEFNSNNQNIEYGTKNGTNYLIDNENRLCINRDSIDTACVFGDGEKKMYILGDSIISSFVSGMLTQEFLENYQIIEFTQSGCYPVINICNFFEGTQYFESVSGITNSVILIGGNEKAFNLNLNYLSETIKLLQKNNNTIILFGYLPQPNIDEKMYLKKNKSYFNTLNPLAYNTYFIENTRSKNTLEPIIQNFENVYLLESFNTFCNTNSCNFFENNHYLFIDHAHLSFLGAKNIVDTSGLKEILFLINKN